MRSKSFAPKVSLNVSQIDKMTIPLSNRTEKIAHTLPHTRYRTYGSVRGVAGDSRPYRDRNLVIRVIRCGLRPLYFFRADI